jgi:hypothetical protein
MEKYCDRIIVAPTKAKKAEWVKKLVKGRQNVVIVNDDPEETRMIALALAGVRNVTKHIILIERPAGKYFPIPPHKDYVVVKDLGEIVAQF